MTIANHVQETPTESDKNPNVPEMVDNSFKVQIVLPNGNSFELTVLPTSTVQDVRQVVYESPLLNYLTCFYLSHNGVRLEESADLASFGCQEHPILNVFPDEYNEQEIRIHLHRVKEALNRKWGVSDSLGLDPSPSFASTIAGISFTGESKSEIKVDVPDFNQSYELDSLNRRIPDGYCKDEITCLNDLNISAWNPPPMYHRLKGDLMYLEVKTLENVTYNITCSFQGFFINQSTDSNFSRNKSEEYPKIYLTLPELLGDISALFAERFAELEKETKARHPFEYFMTYKKYYPWLCQTQNHKKGRSLDTVLTAFETQDTLCSRDWNEDLQSARELICDTAQERVQRDQAFFRTNAEFVEAAVKGVMAIINGIIIPINVGEDDFSQMYIHNGIFYSKGYENKDQFEKYGGAAASHVAVSKDIDGINMVNAHELENICTLGTVMIDYKGQRIVAQSIVPGILKRNSEEITAVKYGSVDGGNEILNDSDFEKVATKLGKALHLKTHGLKDGQGKEHYLATSMDTKWVQGTDSRQYVLDLYRCTPVDCVFLEQVRAEKATNPYPHEIILLRPELVQLFYEHKFRKALQVHQENKVKNGEEAGITEETLADFNFSLALNPDVFTHCQLAGNPSEIEKDEELVREASGFVSVAISQLIMDYVHTGIATPVESESLTENFHQRGINMRYLGKVTELLDNLDSFSGTAFKKLLKDEMVARAAKHLIRQQLENLPIHKVQSCISEFLNRLFGTKVDMKLRENIELEVKSRFRYEIPEAYWKTLNATLLRSICLKVGIQMNARDYKFGKKDCFVPEDILNIYPIIKFNTPKAAFANEALEHGISCISQGKKEMGIDLVRESISMFEQVYGPVHPETAKSYANLAMIYLKEGDNAGAILAQRRATLATERTVGFDHPETIRQYMNLGYLEFFEGNRDAGLKLMKFANDSWKFYLQEPHQELISFNNNLSVMLQKMEENDLAIEKLLYLQEMTKILYGENSEQYASSFDSLTRCYFLIGDYRKALASQQFVFKFYRKHLGESHETTVRCKQVMKTLTEKAVEAAKKDRMESK